MSDDPSTNASRWRDYLPWLILVRCFRISVGMRMLVLGAGGVVATVAGWRIFWRMFDGSSDAPYLPPWPWTHELVNLPEALASEMTKPLQLMLVGNITHFTLGLLCLAWALLVWSYVGAVLTRTAALRLCRDESVSWSAAGGFSISKFPAYFSAPIFPFIGLLLASIPVMLLGLLANLDIGLIVVGLVWPLALLLGLFMTIIMVGFVFGFPFMWSTISTEGTDAFDALSRSYAYVYQRPLHYLFYAFVATVLGSLGYLIIRIFITAVPELALWAADWGASKETVAALRQAIAGTGPAEASGMASIGLGLIFFFSSCVKVLAAGYLASYFWTATSAIYLLLRRDVDAAELDEVFLGEEEESYGLPPLSTDESGVAGAPESSDDSGSDVE